MPVLLSMETATNAQGPGTDTLYSNLARITKKKQCRNKTVTQRRHTPMVERQGRRIPGQEGSAGAKTQISGLIQAMNVRHMRLYKV
jgi:hypothetical protein